MLSFLLFCAGLCELHGILNYDEQRETMEANKGLTAKLESASSPQEKSQYLKDSGMLGMVFKGLFQFTVMLAAAFFAFKATFFLMLPIWLLGLCSSQWKWKTNKTLYTLDNLFCTTMYFMAAWVVA